MVISLSMWSVFFVLASIAYGSYGLRVQFSSENLAKDKTLWKVAAPASILQSLGELNRSTTRAGADDTFQVLKELGLFLLAFNPGAVSRCPGGGDFVGHRRLIFPSLQRMVWDGDQIRCYEPSMQMNEAREIEISASLDEQKITNLFAWIARALANDERYGNLMTAFAAVFGEYDKGDPLGQLLMEAVASAPGEEDLIGQNFSLQVRERNSLGAMGGAQWRGVFKTRPHSLLNVSLHPSVEAWVESLARGERKNLRRAMKQNFTVTSKIIEGNQPAPHSTLGHFRCVVEHEVRLLASTPNNFFAALQQAVGRYVNTLSQAGEIHEYRDEHGRVIAFAHEVRKGRVIRGQWFYATDMASKRYVWFHSVQELVRRAIEAEDIDYADLGPSGADAFTELKERWGFASVDNWHLLADYTGAFRYGNQKIDIFKDALQNALEMGR